MRNTVVKELERMAEQDGRICIITADLGYSVMEDFAAKFPSRFFNVGISEQVMTSAAAGMALCGNIVITYSIGNFATLRCIEQIRNDVCYHNANVKVIAVGGGFAYGQLGMSHHATEDIAMMRVLPNMHVFVPADPEEALAAIRCAVQTEGPCYLRLARRGEPVLYPKPEPFDITAIQTVRRGTDAALLACGPLLQESIRAAELLAQQGVDAGVYSVPTVKPLDERGLAALAAQYPLLVTMEEHVTAGGLGGAVAEAVSGMPVPHARLLRLGLQDVFTSVVGSHDYLCEYYGLSAARAAEAVRRALDR